jgi:hypothetical protein
MADGKQLPNAAPRIDDGDFQMIAHRSAAFFSALRPGAAPRD